MGAHTNLSILSVVFRLMQQAVLATNLLFMFAASILLDQTLPVSNVVAAMFPTFVINGNNNDDNAVATATTTMNESLAFVFLLIHKYGYLLALIFFGISMAILGYVVSVWGVFPKWIGYLLGLSGVAYILDSTLYFLKSGYDGQATGILMLPVLITEILFAGCLLLKKQTWSDHRNT
ncbi:hypothetical protein ACA910_018424 [Epithemia clementina (nom. ined.)]